jgi:hypothetical protein
MCDDLASKMLIHKTGRAQLGLVLVVKSVEETSLVMIISVTLQKVNVWLRTERERSAGKGGAVRSRVVDCANIDEDIKLLHNFIISSTNDF